MKTLKLLEYSQFLRHKYLETLGYVRGINDKRADARKELL